MAGVYAIQLASSLIPGAGIVTSGVVNFATTYIAGLVFLMVLTRLFKTQRQDVENMSDEELVKSVKEAFANIDAKVIFKEAKDLFTTMRKDGTLNEVSEGVDISDDSE